MSKLKQVAEVVCEHFNVPIEKMFKEGKKGNVIKAKQVISFIGYRYLGYNYIAIASFFGLKEHTTILARVRTIQDSMDSKTYLYDEMINIMPKVVNIIDDDTTCIMISVPKEVNYHEVIRQISHFDIQFMFIEQPELKKPVPKKVIEPEFKKTMSRVVDM